MDSMMLHFNGYFLNSVRRIENHPHGFVEMSWIFQREADKGLQRTAVEALAPRGTNESFCAKAEAYGESPQVASRLHDQELSRAGVAARGVA